MQEVERKTHGNTPDDLETEAVVNTLDDTLGRPRQLTIHRAF